MSRQLTVHADVPAPTRISARIAGPDGDVMTVVTEANVSLDDSATPWLPATVPGAMRRRWGLSLEGPVDEVALRQVDSAQDIIAGWFPRHYRRVAVTAAASTNRPVADRAPRATGVGCFFSGGVDSFYSAITQHDRITHLIFVHGFDVKIGDDELAALALNSARSAAAELGKPLIEVTTTLRSAFGDRMKLRWGPVFHGPALAHVGLALSPHLRTVIIPSSHSRAQLTPRGSHPDLDPLWSSGEVAFEHHELEVNRFGKILRIRDSDTAMNHLRVCWVNPDGAFNCGRCPKCIRTKIGLTIAGAQSPTLPGAVDPRAVRRMITTSIERGFLHEAIATMDEVGYTDPELKKAITVAIRRSRLWQPIFR